MDRLAALLLFYAPMAVCARGGHCYSSGCYRAKGQIFWFALIVGGGFLAFKALALVLAWVLGTLEKQRRNPGWLGEFLTACKRLFTNL
ncbi:MAG: hypothetical protein PPHEESC_6336 [uncultured Paraburkholderia sp.]|nr:MAG: hypothetical protein PPHEESC_6336 [uncultured Paraburkholderia sp.]CAH2942371.1 MAG: hypothetical protein PPHERAN_5540 [uncultured Paraburkholderia sp.]CAH2946153.1 MAG: hypothetical protein PPHEMADMSA_6429 [uncultured Paraburkholderia sp.]